MKEKEIIESAFILVLSGIAQYHDDGVIVSTKPGITTVSFPTQSVDYAIIKKYWNNGNLCSFLPYRNGLRHGKCLFYKRLGDLAFSTEYNRGELINRSEWNWS